MNQFKRKLITQAALILIAGTWAGSASATHKNWLLKNGGAECSWSNPGNREYSNGLLVNPNGSPSREAICPVALSGRWAGTTTTPGMPGLNFNGPTWASALGAAIYFNKATQWSENVICAPVATFTSGATYYGQTVWSTPSMGTGLIHLDLAYQIPVGNGGSTWGDGSDLEAHDAEYAVSLSIQCSIPGDGTSIVGQRVRICALTEECWEEVNGGSGEGIPSPPPNPFPSGGLSNHVQTSGIECVPEGPTGVSGWQRTDSGMRYNNMGSSRLFCPLTPPSDDSHEPARMVTQPAVYYSGSTAPDCKLRWWRRDLGATAQESAPFQTSSVGSFVFGANTIVGEELEVGVSCSVASGVTINGAVANMTVSGISSGQ